MTDTPPLDAATAGRYARAGLANVAREYPNHPMHLLLGPDDVGATPSALHPLFFGSYDWHSSVHQHWMLVRLLRRFPELDEGPAVRDWFTTRCTPEAVATEAAYLGDPARRGWERPYGWAWLLTLAAELHVAARDDALRGIADELAGWAATLTPLVEVVRGRCVDWLATTTYPQRSGTHANSAFACGLLHDAAAATGDAAVTAAVGEAALRWYGRDAGYLAAFEPSANDFLSPALVEADLLRRILGPAEFAGWFHRFLPDPSPLAEPAVVSDRTDPQTVHLDGLNLSRAWCWSAIADALPAGDPVVDLAADAAARHRDAALPAVLGGDYVGEHWLPTFAVYLLDR
ncbi:DUF2891 domain-containing protein [Egicoccus halophilus]|uniref:DUF2891 domain-containing protein n=1 Tax=Egicoccus halophilus TaxID=1670830 RepID=A0A8J3A7J8_9ACTN|nr:DUF2891 domain-containing protein [Egicoccus halophilus]GGI02831.1 hypothetical protein GCM10011354_01690 [Egicoccus halophilus]